MPLKHFGSTKISPNGQAGIPVELRRAFGINKRSQPIQIFANVETREIRLIEDVDGEKLYEVLQRLNRNREKS
jgi:bifunctional DNA-binding transcriptional regulator/antitoxin component of YhaV-PrlF toxin-antitoxin module